MTRPAAYSAPATVSALQSSIPNDGLKVIFCLFANGGWDSHNMFLPHTGNPNLSFYESARPAGVRINASEKLPLSGTNWALHPALTHWRDQWDAGRLAVLQDVGTLNEPTTAAQYDNIATASRYRPLSIGAHDVQQLLWRNGLQHQPPDRTTGWMGRVMDLFDGIWNTPTAANQNNLLLSLVSGAGNNVQARPYAPRSAAILPVQTRPAPAQYGTSGGAATRLRELFTEAEGAGLAAPAGPNRIREAWRYALREALAAPGFISSRLVALPAAASTALNNAGNMRAVVQAIHTANQRPELGIRRMVVYVSAPGGWDHHAQLRGNQDPLLATFNTQIAALTEAINLLGLSNRVTFFTQSEFGRTFRSNNNFGSDHGWGGHAFIWGGAVNGGLYGQTPNYSPTGPQATLSGNQFVPTTSTEQYYATLLRWFGLPASLIPLVLPAAANPRQPVGSYTPVAYSPQALGFLPAG